MTKAGFLVDTKIRHIENTDHARMILVVEDEGMIALDLKARLERFGYLVPEVAKTAAEACRLAELRRPDLVLMDIRLQGKSDGIEAANSIRKDFDVPVVFVTAHADPDTLERAKVTGPFGYIVKPFRTTDIRAQIEMALYKHHAERKLRTSEAWFSATLRNVGDGVITAGLDEEIQFMNPSAERLTGWTMAEAKGKVLADVFRLADAETTGTSSKVARVADCKPQAADGCLPFRDDHLLRHRSGSSSTIEVTLSANLTEDSLRGTLIVFRDVTAQRDMERKVRQSAARQRAIVDTAIDGIILIDAEGVVQTFNPACERLFGYSAFEVIGQNAKMLMPVSLADEHDNYLSWQRETGKKIGTGREVVGRRKDASNFPIEISVGEAEQDGAPIFVGIVHDLTARKRTEEQLVQAQKMEMVGQLSGGIAHDFNNLLTVIMGNADLLGEKLHSRPDLKKYCDTVMMAGDRGVELTRRLLAFSRRETLRPAVIDCNSLIDGMKLMLERTLREDIEIRTSFECDLVRAFADAAQLESAILNLALNAKDAMPTGGTLTFGTANALLDQRYHETHLEVVPGAYVLISVTDNGTGMPPEVAERVFEPFFTTKEVGKGSGLGLSMVYGFVKQSNGHVAVYSEPGLGTTIKLYLPAAKGITASTPELPCGEEVPLGKGTVLLVEDDPFVRGYAVGCVESLGYRVITASNGHDALARLATHADEIDILFSDIVMPGGIGGWELAQRALRQKPEIALLLTSGYQMESLLPLMKTMPSVTVLNKPYRKLELAEKLKEVLARRNRLRPMG